MGSLLRTCEGLGVNHIYLSGYTPYPVTHLDSRLPHISKRLTFQIHKTALGAENLIKWSHATNVFECIADLKLNGYTVAALEQSATSVPLHEYKVPSKIAILLGREVEGVDNKLLGLCDVCLEIPMFGEKESFNVVQAAAMTLFKLRFD